MGAGQLRYFEDPLRSDDDVGHVEGDVRKRSKKGRVKLPGPLVAFPTLAGRDDLIDAFGGEGVDQPLHIAGFLRLRVFDPQPADGLIQLGG